MGRKCYEELRPPSSACGMTPFALVAGFLGLIRPSFQFWQTLLHMYVCIYRYIHTHPKGLKVTNSAARCCSQAIRLEVHSGSPALLGSDSCGASLLKGDHAARHRMAVHPCVSRVQGLKAILLASPYISLYIQPQVHVIYIYTSMCIYILYKYFYVYIVHICIHVYK